MVDTCKLKHYGLPVSIDSLKSLGWKFLRTGKFPTLIYNSEKENLPNLTALLTPDNIWQISAEGSFPKIIHGHNAKLLNQAEVNDTFQFISDYVEANSRLPFNAKNAVVHRADYAKDLQVSEEKVPRLIQKLAKRTLPRKRKNFVEDTTIYFNSKDKQKSDSTRIYPKLQEVFARKNPSREAIEFAKGILRFERVLLKNALQQLVKRQRLPDRKAKTLLTQEVSDFVIAETLSSLNYDEIEISTDSVLLTLLKCFPTNQAISLYGFLEMVKIYGENFYKNPSHGISRTTYFNHVKKLKEVSLWQTQNA
jgi:II/X family phage/plasmid replication protein